MSAPIVKSYIRDQVEIVSPQELKRLQLQRLILGVDRLSKNVPLYTEKLHQYGVTPDSVRSLEDLALLPFTTKQDLRDNYPFGLLAVPMKEVIRVHASSGTTGKPTVVVYTRNDIAVWSELMARTYAAAGVTEDDIVHNAYGYGLFTGGLGFHYGAERLGASVIPVSGGNTKRQLMIMRDFGSTVLCCTPSYSLLIAEVAEEEGVDPRSLSLKVGLFGAEPWSERMREEIESRLGIVALNVYGLSEVIGPGVAVECTQKRGLHIFEDHFIPEIVDPTTNERLPDGEMGELVLTCVTKEALPLLRYRTRDRTRLTRERCECGRTGARIDRLAGRTDDMIIVRGVNVFPSQIETVLLQVGDVEPHYQIVVDRSADYMDELDVLVEASAEVYGNQEHLIQLEKRLNYEVRTTLGITCNVKLVGPERSREARVRRCASSISESCSRGSAFRLAFLRVKEGTMKLETMFFEKDRRIGCLTLNRPQILNAMNYQGSLDLNRVAEMIRDDPDVRLVLIRGAGHAFCTGIDLKQLAAGETPHQYYENWDRALRILEQAEKVLICAMHGYALGGGLQLALACDIRIATEDCKFGLPAIKEGIVPGLGTFRLPRYIGLGRAKWMALSGENIDGRRAYEIGLIDHIVKSETFDADVGDLVKKYSRVCSEGSLQSKMLLNMPFDMPHGQFFEEYLRRQRIALASPDHETALLAYREGREPDFSA